MLCHVAAAKSLSVHHYSAGYILFPLESLSPSRLFENRIPLTPALGGVCNIANYNVTYDFSTKYTTLPHHPIKVKLFIKLTERLFGRIPNIGLQRRMCFFTSVVYNNHNLWSCQKVCDALVYILDNIFI